LYISTVPWVETTHMPRVQRYGELRNDGCHFNHTNMLTKLELGQQQNCVQFTLRSDTMIQEVNNWHTVAEPQPSSPPPCLVRHTNRPFGHQSRYMKRLAILSFRRSDSLHQELLFFPISHCPGSGDCTHTHCVVRQSLTFVFRRSSDAHPSAC